MKKLKVTYQDHEAETIRKNGDGLVEDGAEKFEGTIHSSDGLKGSGTLIFEMPEDKADGRLEHAASNTYLFDDPPLQSVEEP